MRILLTRPLADAQRTAARLRRMGHEAILAPLSVIKSLPFEAPRCAIDAIVATSAHALPAAGGAALGRSLPVYAVGSHTAEAARAAGFADVRTSAGSARDLLELIIAEMHPNARLLYLAGVDRKPTLEAGLEAAGIPVLVREVYSATAMEALPSGAADALSGETIDAAMHYSRRSVETFCRLVVQAELWGALRSLAHHCISADCAEPLIDCDAKVIVIAAAPNEEALLSTLPPSR